MARSVFFLAWVLAVVKSLSYLDNSTCVLVSNDDFESTLIQHGPLLVYFTSSFGDSDNKTDVPEGFMTPLELWKTVANKVNSPREDMLLGKKRSSANLVAVMDCSASKNMCDQISGLKGEQPNDYDAIKLVGLNSKGSPEIAEFGGKRDYKTLTAFGKSCIKSLHHSKWKYYGEIKCATNIKLGKNTSSSDGVGKESSEDDDSHFELRL
jgi:hypothetical protein